MASQLGQIGGVELAHYSAAKAAIIGLTKSLAREVSGLGVRVNAVAPGPNQHSARACAFADWRKAKAAELPLGRFGEPEEVAAAVAFLCSDEASLFVGQTIGPEFRRRDAVSETVLITGAGIGIGRATARLSPGQAIRSIATDVLEKEGRRGRR